MIAHTIIVGANSDTKITGKKANCFLAAYYASQAALRLMKPGNEVRISSIKCNFQYYGRCTTYHKYKFLNIKNKPLSILKF